MTLLILLACSKPEPPVPARGANTMDTASYEEAEEFRASSSTPRIKSVVLTGATTGSTPAQVRSDAMDPDGGRLRTSFTWFVNGQRVEGQTQATLPASFFKKDDRLVCEVQVRSASGKASRKSNERVVGNSAPTIDIARIRMDRVDGLKIPASDPDGDGLTFSLSDAPPGMSIDATGTLHFSGSKDQTEGGTFRPRVTVADSHGESVVWDFELNLSAGKGDQTVPKRELSSP
jgi:hypothetical protein